MRPLTVAAGEEETPTAGTRSAGSAGLLLHFKEEEKDLDCCSNNGEQTSSLLDQEEVGRTAATTTGAPDDLITAPRSDLTYLTHQVYRILLALHIPPCMCQTCACRHQEQNKLILASALNGTHSESDSTGDPDITERVGSQENVSLNTSATLTGSSLSVPPGGDSSVYSDPWSSVISQNDLGGLFQRGCVGAGSHGHGHLPPLPLHNSYKPRRMRQIGSGRKSKYCTASEKAAVAQYAAVHGASAAARKFNIPPAVAAYYHRKILNRSLPKGRRPRESTHSTHPTLDPEALTVSTIDSDPMESGSQESLTSGAPNPEESGNSSLSDMPESPVMPHLKAEGGMEDSPSSLFPSQDEIQAAVNVWLQKPPSPSFSLGSFGKGTGGRGRGRPKLIGDELDAKLLVHLSEIRKGMTERLTPDKVLGMATAFIREESPGLLVEDGGTILLKPTWAIKVLSRLNDARRMTSMQ